MGRLVLRTHAQIAYLYLWKHRTLPIVFQRPWPLRVVFLLGFPFVAAFTALCLVLDDLLFWGHHRSALQPPVFIVGNPRSGTTVLHRLLAKDDRRFYCFHLWEMLFPSLLQQRILRGCAALDRALGGPICSWLFRTERRALQKSQGIHPSGLLLPEEDSNLMKWLLNGVGLMFPAANLKGNVHFDEELPEAEQQTVMAFYESCIHRHAFQYGPEKRLLSKSPAFSGRVNALNRQFPDSVFIYLVRNPIDVAGSIISMGRALSRKVLRREPPPEFDHNAFTLIRTFYLETLEKLDRLPAERVFIVRYDDLMQQPRETVARIYQHFGWTPSATFRDTLDADVAEMSAYRSQHSYSLADSPITPQFIADELRSVFERFHFELPEVSVAPEAISRLDLMPANVTMAEPAEGSRCMIPTRLGH